MKRDMTLNISSNDSVYINTFILTTQLSHPSIILIELKRIQFQEKRYNSEIATNSRKRWFSYSGRVSLAWEQDKNDPHLTTALVQLICTQQVENEF